ncbi:MAG: CoA transferase [Proteobacteria bacterium]|nr:CoA transferase [Pseudomonadota bacterium]
MPGPLEGIRVVELTTAIQGPAAALFFANMGADVVKVEPPMGDSSRYHRGAKNPLPAEAFTAPFLAMNKGKRSVVLDAHTDLGADALHRLLSQADVFISNYRALALTRMGLDLEGLVAKYPRLVVGHVNGFGPLGPDADKAMLDGAAQARGGVVSMCGHPDAPPTPPGTSIADHGGAMQLALACMTGLVSRSATGKGQLIRTSSLGAQLWLQMWELQHSALTGNMLTRDGQYHPNLKAPYGVYLSRDGIPVQFVAAMTEDSWASWWIFVDKPEMILVEEWNSAGKRIGISGSETGLDEVRAEMKKAFASRDFAELEAFLYSEPEIIWERVRGHADVLTDPQNLANDYIVDIDLPVTGPVKTVGSLISFSETPTDAPHLPPGLGEHTDAVLADVGMSQNDIAALNEHAASVREEMYAALLGES